MSTGSKVSELFGQLAPRMKGAVAEAADTPLPEEFAKLPEIETGVAKLVRIGFHEKDGVLSFRAGGEIDAPMYGKGGVPVKGLTTSVYFSFTPANAEEAGKDVVKVFQRLVGEDKTRQLLAAYSHPDGGSDLVKVAEAIEGAAKNPKTAIYFRFSNAWEENKSGRIDAKTGKPFPGRCWERWQRAVPGYTPFVGTPTPSPSGAPSTNGHAPSPQGSVPAVQRTMGAAKPTPVPHRHAVPPPPPPTADTLPGLDWEEEVARAEAGDDSAVDRVRAECIRLGRTEDDIDASSWEVITGWLVAGTEKGKEGPTPVVGNNVKFAPPDPKDKTGAKRQRTKIDCEITAVHADRTMDLVKIGDESKVWQNVTTDSPHVEYPG